MKRLVIPNGGRQGALIVTENGVRAILPFSASTEHLLRATSSLVHAASAASDSKDGRSIARLSTTLANMAVQQIEEAIGPLDADSSVLYYDADGGFSCGSTGRSPIPFPWPPSPIPTLQDLLAAGAVEPEVVEFMEKGREKQIPLRKLFQSPAEVAAELHVKLSQKSIADLKQLDPEAEVTIKEPVDREILGFFHKVLADGRFLNTWFAKPYETSQALGVALSDQALERLMARGALASHGPSGGSPIADFGVSVVTISVADAVIVYIVATKSRPIEQVVVDRSGVEKI